MRKSILNMAVIAALTIGGTATAQAATSGSAGTWSKVSNQYGTFSVSGTKIVRYGTGSKWVMKTIVNNKGSCTNQFFGKDPATGLAKTCEVFNSTGSTATAPTSYNVKLSWTIPTTRQNGKPLALSELKGYEVYYATDNSASTANDKIVKVTGGSVSSSTISQLPAGTYYFSISAIDVNGLKSPLSTMIATKVGG